jgi:hypothetical protein
MSHEDFLEADELERERERFKESPQRKTSVKKTTAKKPTTSRKRKTASHQSRNRKIATVLRNLTVLRNSTIVVLMGLMLFVGIGIGANVSHLPMFKERPAPIATETLSDFVARESQSLSADERRKLIAVTEKILAAQFETPSALREEFYYQRLKAGLHDSPGFNAFWGKWAEKVQARSRESKDKSQDEDDSVESMRTIYTELLRGLSSFSGEPVEGFLQSSLSIIDKALAANADEPVTPGFVRIQESGDRSQEPVQRTRIFGRR